jgi:hypothetical protein
MITRNLYREGMNLWSPRVDFIWQETDSLVLEFPLYNAIVALLYKIFGLHEIIGRLVSIAFATGATYFLYRFSRRFYEAPVSLFATLFFTLSPLSIFYGRAFMPEPLMLFSGIGALLYFHTWLEDGGPKNFTLALIFSILTFLTKFTMLHLAFPMFYLCWAKYGWKLVRRRSLGFFLALFLIPSTIWFLHVVLSEHNRLYMLWLFSSSEVLRRRDEFFITMLNRLRTDVLTQVGFILFLFGLFLGRRKNSEYVFDVWLGSTLVYVLVIGVGNYAHNYYQLPIVPIASIYAGKAMAYILKPQVLFNAWSRQYVGLIAVVGILLAAGFESVRIARPWYGQDFPGLYQFADVVKRTIPPGEKVMISSLAGGFVPWDPRIMYAVDHKGWNVPATELSDEIQRLRPRGVRHLIVYPFEGVDSNLVKPLIATYRLLAVKNTGQTGGVFDLISASGDIQQKPLIREGFEQAAAAKREWENWGDEFSITSERHWEGTRSLELRTKGRGFRVLQHRRIEVSPGALYVARVRVHAEQLLGPGVGIYMSTYRTAADWERLSSSQSIVPKGKGWQEASLAFSPPEDARFLLVSLGGSDLDEVVYFDDFELLQNELTSPAQSGPSPQGGRGERRP